MYKYKAELSTSGGKLEINAVEIGGGEVLAIFKDDLGSWRKTYFDVKSFQDFIYSLQIKNKISISEYMS